MAADGLRGALAWVALSVLVAGASSLVVAPAPSYDPWAWLLWGREISEGTLSTREGPAFKPLAVGICALLAPLGPAAAVSWVVLVRAATILAAWLAFRLGRRLSGGSRAGGLLAAGGVLLSGALPTYAATGAETPLVLLLVLAGAEAWRSGRAGWALACGVGCALLRVEAWPFLLVLGVALWRRSPTWRPALAALALAIPAAWLVPEWLGSGDLLRSGDRARVPNPGQPALADVPFLAALRAGGELVLWPLWIGVALIVARPGRSVPHLRAWALAGAAWLLLVAAMAQGGFSGEPRYAVPGAALLAVAGASRLVSAARRAARPGVALAAVAVVVVAAAAPRVTGMAGLREAQAHQWELAQRLDDAIELAGGRAAVLACGRPYVGRLRGPLMAHALDVPKHAVEPDAPVREPGVAFRSALTPEAEPAPRIPAGFRPRGRAGPWTVHAACRDPGPAAGTAKGVRVP